jgi:tRNA-specific 2-thiouridylase
MLPQRELARTLFPIGHLTKAEVRDRATALGLRTAAKPDSQDVCFITQAGGRTAFLGARIPFRTATVVDAVDGLEVGKVNALEMVTLGQRRGIGLPGGGPKRYVVGIDHSTATVTVGDEAMLLCETLVVRSPTWAHEPFAGDVLVQTSAHGATAAAVATLTGDEVHLRWRQPERRVSPGQSVVLYDATDTYVLGGGIAG